MKNKTLKIRPPVKWHGGKYYLAKRIVEFFPPHLTYVEPYGGAASVLLNKPPAQVEVYNDLDGRIVRLFRVLRENGDDLRKRLTLTPYSEEEFEEADDSDWVGGAHHDFIQWRQSIGGRGDAFSYTLHRSRRGMADVVSGYLSAIDEVLPMVIERLRVVQILRREALDVIAKWDSPDTLFYCDPPYLHETRATKDVYGHEMTKAEHHRMGCALNSCRGKVIVSGYPSGMYDRMFKGWRVKTFDMPNHAASGKTKARKKETLWMNFG